MPAPDTLTLRSWLREQPFTLTMSSGFFSFFAHCGMLSVLEAEGLRPQQITGSSAGALAGACWASGCAIDTLKAILFRLSKADFWDPGLGLGLLRGQRFRRLIAQICAVDRLEQCPIPVTVSVFDLAARSTATLRTGPIQDAVYASCALPLLFQPIRIRGRLYCDGGIKDRPGLAGVKPGTRVFYHHIASRSPWRRKNSPALQVPRRDNMTSLVVQKLPRVSPNYLDQGRIAYEKARQAAQQALDLPLETVIRV